MEKLVIVSSDSHAAMPSEKWTEYFEKRFHEHLPQIQYESDLYTTSVVPLSKMSMGPDGIEEHFSASGGYRGVYDLDVRLEQMDREGIAAELVYHGDARVGERPVQWTRPPARGVHRLVFQQEARVGDLTGGPALMQEPLEFPSLSVGDSSRAESGMREDQLTAHPTSLSTRWPQGDFRLGAGIVCGVYVFMTAGRYRGVR